MEAHRLQNKTTLKDAYQKSLKKQKEHIESLFEQAMESATKYEATRIGSTIISSRMSARSR